MQTTPSSHMIELRGVSHAYKTKAGPLPVLDNLKHGGAGKQFLRGRRPRRVAASPR